MSEYSKEIIRDLIDSKLPWSMIHSILSSFKDPDRFGMYLTILQERVTWKERILLPYGLHLYIVQKDQSKVVKCDCGFEFGDYKRNWKLSALIYVRETDESLSEIYPTLMAGDSNWTTVREYYCPGCKSLLEVEAAPPGYPIICDFIPDLDALYGKWLRR